MSLDPDVCYRALQAHDARHDGVFFVGVSSTGIYCRPVCPARTPKRENCAFYISAASAEQAGYRPCLRCRPELAPGRAPVDRVPAWAKRAVRRIEQGALDEMSVDTLAETLGVSGRQLRRAVHDRFGVSPIQLAQTHRLLTAKRMLADTALPVGEIAHLSGFASLRRFNACFQEHYALAPTDLRKRVRPARSELVCELGFRPPFNWPGLLEFFTLRSIPQVEKVTEGSYARTVRLKNARGWIVAGPHPERNALVVKMSEALAPKVPVVADRLRQLFDLAAEPAAIGRVLGPLMEANPGVRVPGSFDGFETAVRAILGQQVTVRFAATLAGRVVERFGASIETPVPELTKLFPTACEIAGLTVDQLGELGVIRSRGRAIIALAQAVADREIVLDPSTDEEETRQKLRTIPGIGEWTADYISMRCLGNPDAFPAGDLGVLKALGTTDRKQAIATAEKWRPWRAYATMRLWQGAISTPLIDRDQSK